MFGLGFWEIIATLVLAIIIIRPSDIPKLLHKLGKLYGRVTTLSRQMLRALRESEEQEGELSQLEEPPNGQKDDVRRGKI